MRDLDTLRDATDRDIVNAIYDTVEKNRDALDSDSYCELMNILLVMHERLSMPPAVPEQPEPPHVVQVMGRVRLVSEEDRERKIIHALQVKHELERDMVEFRRTYRQGRNVLSQSHANILKTIHRLERLPITPVIEEHPIIL